MKGMSARTAALNARKSRLLFCSVHLVLVAALFFRTPSVVGGLLAALLSAALYLSMLLGDAAEEPAGGCLARMVFFGVLALLCLQQEALRANLAVVDALPERQSLQWVLLAMLGLAAGITGLLCKGLGALAWIGAEALGAAVILRLYAGGRVLSPVFAAAGEMVLVAFAVLAAVWMLIAQVTAQFAPQRRGSVHLMGVLLLLGTVAALALETALISSLALRPLEWLQKLPVQGTALWWVPVGVLVLGGGAVILYDSPRSRIGPDALLLLSGAGWALLLGALLIWYIPQGWAVLFLYGWIVCYSLQNELFGRKTLEVGNGLLLVGAALGLLSAVWLVHRGQWPLVLVGVMFGLLFQSQRGQRRGDRQADMCWMLALCAIASFALAWIWRMRLAEDNLRVVLLLLVACGLVMGVLAWPHPHGRRAPVPLRAALCVAMGLLCLIPMTRRGVSLTVAPDLAQNTVRITAAARGSGNAVAGIRYYWTASSGERIGESVELDSDEVEIELQADCLTVIATDAFGIRTAAVSWTPHSLLAAVADLSDRLEREGW